jgi:hypothetical protein
MTLIALTVNHGYPVLMADILLSSKEGSGMALPTYVNGTADLFFEMEKKPIGLTQKLYVINDRLALALGGRLDKMRTFLNRIQVLYGDVNFDDNDLDEFVTEFENDSGDDLFAIVILRRRSIKDNVFYVRPVGSISMKDSKMFDRTFAGGSGADSFLRYVNSTSAMHTDITNTDRFLSSNLSVIGYFLGLEMLTGNSLTNLWGAGFEMIIFEEGKFVKLKEYTLVVVWCEFGTKIEFNSAPVLTLLFNYEDNALVIRAIDKEKEQFFATPEINDGRESINAKLNDPKHEILIVRYLYHDVDNRDVYHSVTVLPRNENEQGKSPVVFSRDERGKLLMYTDPKYDRQVFETSIEELRKYYNK